MNASRLVAVVAWKALPTNGPLVDGLRRLGIPAELLAPDEAIGRLASGDVALVRLDVTPALDGVEPGLRNATQLQRRGVRLLNRPAPLLVTHDKWQTARRLNTAGIAHPCTVHHTRLGDIRHAALPFVLKPRFGSWGRDVMLCRDHDDLERSLTILGDRPWFRRHGVLLQEVLPSPGHDLRVLVAGDRVVGASRRHAAPGEWRTNEALGGRSVPARPSPEACALALGTARAIGTDLAGIDLLPQPDGRHVVLEINGAVDFDATDSLPDRDVYRDIAEALELLRVPATNSATTIEHPSRERTA
jgi:RimK family alpha-L-glutamate ligase